MNLLGIMKIFLEKYIQQTSLEPFLHLLIIKIILSFLAKQSIVFCLNNEAKNMLIFFAFVFLYKH